MTEDEIRTQLAIWETVEEPHMDDLLPLLTAYPAALRELLAAREQIEALKAMVPCDIWCDSRVWRCYECVEQLRFMNNHSVKHDRGKCRVCGGPGVRGRCDCDRDKRIAETEAK